MTERNNKMSEKVNFIDRVLFLNGITRAGKFLLGKVASCLETVEHFQYVSVLEHLPFLVSRGLVSEEAAITLSRINVDEHSYNMAIGRNLNFRFTDASSLYNCPDFDSYQRRSLTEDIPTLIEKYKSEKRIPSFIVHENLPDIKFFYKAFPEIRIVNLHRHPVDLASSWYKRGWGERYGQDPLAFTPVFKGTKGPVPWYASSWAEEYESLSPVDRVIRSISCLIETGAVACEQLSVAEREKMIDVTYEELVEDTPAMLAKVSEFMKLSVKESLDVVMKRERVPRELPPEGRRQKLAEIEKIASKDKLELLYRISDGYESRFFR